MPFIQDLQQAYTAYFTTHIKGKGQQSDDALLWDTDTDGVTTQRTPGYYRWVNVGGNWTRSYHIGTVPKQVFTVNQVLTNLSQALITTQNSRPPLDAGLSKQLNLYMIVAQENPERAKILEFSLELRSGHVAATAVNIYHFDDEDDATVIDTFKNQVNGLSPKVVRVAPKEQNEESGLANHVVSFAFSLLQHSNNPKSNHELVYSNHVKQPYVPQTAVVEHKNTNNDVINDAIASEENSGKNNTSKKTVQFNIDTRKNSANTDENSPRSSDTGNGSDETETMKLSSVIVTTTTPPAPPVINNSPAAVKKAELDQAFSDEVIKKKTIDEFIFNKTDHNGRSSAIAITDESAHNPYTQYAKWLGEKYAGANIPVSSFLSQLAYINLYIYSKVVELGNDESEADPSTLTQAGSVEKIAQANNQKLTQAGNNTHNALEKKYNDYIIALAAYLKAQADFLRVEADFFADKEKITSELDAARQADREAIEQENNKAVQEDAADIEKDYNLRLEEARKQHQQRNSQRSLNWIRPAPTIANTTNTTTAPAPKKNSYAAIFWMIGMGLVFAGIAVGLAFGIPAALNQQALQIGTIAGTTVAGFLFGGAITAVFRMLFVKNTQPNVPSNIATSSTETLVSVPVPVTANNHNITVSVFDPNTIVRRPAKVIDRRAETPIMARANIHQAAYDQALSTKAVAEKAFSEKRDAFKLEDAVSFPNDVGYGLPERAIVDGPKASAKRNALLATNRVAQSMVDQLSTKTGLMTLDANNELCLSMEYIGKLTTSVTMPKPPMFQRQDSTNSGISKVADTPAANIPSSSNTTTAETSTSTVETSTTATTTTTTPTVEENSSHNVVSGAALLTPKLQSLRLNIVDDYNGADANADAIKVQNTNNNKTVIVN